MRRAGGSKEEAIVFDVEGEALIQIVLDGTQSCGKHLALSGGHICESNPPGRADLIHGNG